MENIVCLKKYINQKFNFAFGQHSGVIDTNKDKYELARFPINEKYGDLKRFEFCGRFISTAIQKSTSEQKYINNSTNPPDFSVEFFKEQKNISNINLLF